MTRAEADATAISLYERGGQHTAQMLSRAGLSTDGDAGPLLIDDGLATVYVPPGWTASLDTSGNIVIRKEG